MVLMRSQPQITPLLGGEKRALEKVKSELEGKNAAGLKASERLTGRSSLQEISLLHLQPSFQPRFVATRARKGDQQAYWFLLQ
jgi:hypothetical protein